MTELAKTHFPCLNELFNTSSVKQEAKSAAIELAHIQALVRDPMAPLI